MKIVIKRLLNNYHKGVISDNPLVNEIIKMAQEGREEEQIELMISMVLGGHETTARLMLGAFYGLMRHPKYIKQIRNEVSQLALKNEDRYSYYNSVHSLPRLNTVIDEALRLFPPVWLIARSSEKNIEIRGEMLQEGTQVLIPFLLLHRLHSYWGEDAELFRPERFDEIPAIKRRHYFFPFAHGSARCPGGDFARMESALAIASLLEEFDMTLADPNQLPEPQSAGTFRLFDKLEVIISPRK